MWGPIIAALIGAIGGPLMSKILGGGSQPGQMSATDPNQQALQTRMKLAQLLQGQQQGQMQGQRPQSTQTTPGLDIGQLLAMLFQQGGMR